MNLQTRQLFCTTPLDGAVVLLFHLEQKTDIGFRSESISVGW